MWRGGGRTCSAAGVVQVCAEKIKFQLIILRVPIKNEAFVFANEWQISNHHPHRQAFPVNVSLERVDFLKLIRR